MPRHTEAERPAKIARAQQLRDIGWSWERIAADIGVSKTCIIRWINPLPQILYNQARREQHRSRLVRGPQSSYRASQADIAARLAEIPFDDRDLTAVVMGDPLTGRSALDKMRGSK